jgi:hypothetical protein
MDERRLRYPAGSNGDGTTHRVGLTRHCLASGAVQLPFALRDSLPEGDLLAYDVVRDETVVLASEPPRRLSGLEAFFAAHELQVNDQLELRLQGGEVRLAPRPRSRRSDDAGDAPAARRPSRWTSLVDPTPASEEPPAEARPDVLERIGSVTVRRLGADMPVAPPGSELPGQPALRQAARDETVPADQERDTAPRAGADPGIASDEDIDALLVIGSDASAEPAATPRDETRADEATTNRSDRRERADIDTVQPEPPASDGPRHEGPSPSRAQSARGAPRPGTAQQGALFGQPTNDPPRRARRGRAPRRPPATRPAPAEPPPVREQDLADPSHGASIVSSEPPRSSGVSSREAGPSDAPASSVRAAPHAAVPTPSPTPIPTPRPTPARRPSAPRPSATSGPTPEDVANGASDAATTPEPLADLRRRVVLWLLEPETPVIVTYERVQERFDLAADRTREVLGMILASPPPTLRLTLLREGMLRVSRVTVEQEA